MKGAEDECGIYFWVFAETQIKRRVGSDAFADLSIEELNVGARVAVWISGIIFDTCPQEARADAIELLE